MARKFAFSPLPPRLMSSLVKRALVFGDRISKSFPKLQTDLIQANINISPREYAAAAVVTAIFYGIFTFVLLLVLSIFIKADLLPFALLAGLGFFGFHL